MGVELPELGGEELERRLRAAGCRDLAPAVHRRLLLHYEELRRWNPRLNLVGPGTRGEIIERHFAESLAAFGLLRAQDRTLVDIGSGAGFPGLVLAAARPDLRVVLVESREKKCGFLRTVAQKCGLDCVIVNARVGVPLPPGIPEQIDVITLRAVRLEPEETQLLTQRIVSRGRLLLWATEDLPGAFPGLAVVDRVALSGADRRRIVALERLQAGER